jgi:hemerythrin-like domain-containing protein
VPAEVAETVLRMENQHDGIAEMQETVTTALTAWRAGADEDSREALATALEELLARVTEHLAAEEEHILPLAATHMTSTPQHAAADARQSRRTAHHVPPVRARVAALP